MKMMKPVGVLVVLLLAACSSPEERIAEFLESGRMALDGGDLVTARLEYRNALQIDDKLAPAWFGLASIASEQAEWREAYAMYERALDIEPDHFEAKLGFGQLQLISGQMDKALSTTDQLLVVDSESAPVLALRAAVLLKLGDEAGAVKNANKALAIESENVEALAVLAAERVANGEFEAALTYIERGIRGNTDNSALYIMRIEVLSRLGRDEAVETAHLDLIARFPDIVPFRHLLARYYLAQFREDDAEQVYRDIVAVTPDNFEAKANVIRFVFAQRGYAAAVSEVEALISNASETADLQFALVSLHEAEGAIEARDEVLHDIAASAEDLDDRLRAQGLLAANVMRSGDIDSGLAMLDDILEQDPRNGEALTLRAAQHIDRRELDLAISELRTVLADVPDSAGALLLLGRAHELQGAVDLADDMYARAIEASDEASYRLAYAQFLQNVGRAQRSEAMLTEAFKRGERNLALLTRLAQVRLTLGDLEGAQVVADRIRELDDPDGVSDQIMGAIYAGKQDFDRSIDAFRAAVDASPPNNQPLVALIRTYIRAGRVQDAEDFLNALIADNPNNVEARLLKAQMLTIQGEIDQAEALYREVVAEFPATTAAWRGLSAIASRTASSDSALAVLDEALAANPGDTTLMITKAGTLEQRGEFEAAIAVYEEILAEQPNADVVANNLASLLSDHRNDEASLAKAHEIAMRFRNSEVPYFQDTLGWTHFRRGNVEQAERLVKAAIDALPDMPVFHYHLGMIYASQGKEAARATFMTALEVAGEGDFAFRQEIEAALQAL